jgi:hypothetical protein
MIKLFEMLALAEEILKENHPENVHRLADYVYLDLSELLKNFTVPVK